MGVHWCGWCKGMGGGGFCEPGFGSDERNCAKEFDEAEKKFKSMISDEAWKLYEKLVNAIAGCE